MSDTINLKRMLVAVMLMLGMAVHTARAAPAADPPCVSVTVVNAWSRATPPGTAVGVVYFDIVNAGAADELLSIDTPDAQRVEMHSTTRVGDIMQMRAAPSVKIPAGQHVAFAPGGYHAMLMDLRKPLLKDETVLLTLIFRNCGEVRVQAVVQGLGASAPTSREAAPVNYRLTVWPARAASPDFELMDADGRHRTLSDYRGRVVVIFFGFLHCPDACPAELFKLSVVMKQLGPSASRVQVLFVTLDPERDTRDLLKSYVLTFDSRFIGLTGTSADIDRAAGNFYVVYARVSEGAGYTIDHSTSTFVVDANGRLRLIGAEATSAADYAHDLSALVTEAESGT